MRVIMILFYLVIVVIGVSFAVLNAAPAQINLYFTIWVIPVSLLVIGAMFLGVLLGFGASVLRYLRLKHEMRKVKNQLKLTEIEIKNLRAIPIQDTP